MPHIRQLLRASALISGLAAAPAVAQTDPAPSQPAPSQDAISGTRHFLDRFNAANTSHDGRLTLQQAQAAHMSWIIRNFSAIDAQHKGYVTVQDVVDYRQRLRAHGSETD